MNVFSKLKTMNDKEIQDWLRKVGRINAKSLGITLLGTDDEVKNRIFRNMSERARTILSTDIENNKKLHIKEDVINSNAGKLEKLMN